MTIQNPKSQIQNLSRKMCEHFTGLVVRKDLVKAVKGNAIVPSYVLEYLLGQYCATSDEDSIQTGIETVKEILAKHYVNRSEAGLVRSQIREKKLRKIIDRISVELNDKEDVYQATFANLGINKVAVPASTVKKHQKLLVGGVWCIADIEYQHDEDEKTVPWILESLKPIQLSSFDIDGYLAARKQFTTEEWIDTLIQSIGFNPESFGRRSKLLQLVRLIPFCERNYNLIELGPKGTGKSHVYSEFSPHGMLISGGEVTVPKLFVNNATGSLGLVGYWDCVAFDEFAGKAKRVDKTLVDIMKNYMANKTFSRGIETLGAEASMAFVGNTQHTVAHMLRHSDLFDELPTKFHDSAFLDRIHFFIPGWEIDIIRGDMFTSDFGFVVDYLAEVLKQQRSFDYSHLYATQFQLSEQISTRDRDSIHKTFSGLVKIIFPNQDATAAELEELLVFAIEGRKRVKDQLMRIDQTYASVRFSYMSSERGETLVRTLEEQEYPQIYSRQAVDSEAETESILSSTNSTSPCPPTAVVEGIDELTEKHLEIKENQKGVSFDHLFGPYVRGASKIVVTDAYIRNFFQAKNMMDLLETVFKTMDKADEVEVHLVTSQDDFKSEQQEDFFTQMQKNCIRVGIKFTWEFDSSIHARHIVTNHGWKILLDRGLDVFQPYENRDAFSLAARLQSQRLCKKFEVTYLKVEAS